MFLSFPRAKNPEMAEVRMSLKNYKVSSKKKHPKFLLQYEVFGTPKLSRGDLETVFPTTSEKLSCKNLFKIQNLKNVHRYSIQFQTGYPIS